MVLAVVPAVVLARRESRFVDCGYLIEAENRVDNIAEMITLQEVDGRLDTIKKRLKEVEALLGRPPFLDALRGEVDAQKGLLKEATGDRKEKEVEAEASRLKITAEEEKLYSGAITESRELRSLQEEIFALRRGLKAQEESGLAQLEREELDREARDYLVRLLKRVEADWSERESELETQRRELVEQSDSIDVEAGEQRASMKEGDLAVYDDHRSRNPLVVAVAEGGVCGACRLTLPTMMLTRARRGAEVVNCPACGRIVFLR